MEELRAQVIAGSDAGQILLMEHDPVITLGRHADERNVLFSRQQLHAMGVELSASTRGGDVTYHGPGQLMVYPVVRVSGVVDFLQRIAGALIAACRQVGVSGAEWRRDPAGVWVGERKLAACGIHISRGVSIHGFALNLSTPEEAWRTIVPCGLSNHGVTSVERELGRAAPSAVEFADLVGPLLVDAAGAGCKRAKALP